MKVSTTYEQLVRQIYQINLYNPAKLGLQNINRLHDELGSPLKCFKTVHVAGTNGKGSVSWKIAKGLEAAGIRTGLFVSPHISCFRERIQVNGQLISEQAVESSLPDILHICQNKRIPATFFELTTALAFCHFQNEKVDAVVLEAGIGGRLDATNIVHPILSVITSIGLEHTRILGSTIEAIAWEKAGIMKSGVPVLLGSQTPTFFLEECAKYSGSPVYHAADFVDDSSVSRNNPEAEQNDFDVINSIIAEAALKVLSRSEFQGKNWKGALDAASASRPPCRFECLTIHQRPLTTKGQPVSVVLDGAHNPDAMQKLFWKLAQTYPNKKYRLVMGISCDKDTYSCLSLALRYTTPDCLHFAQAPHPRAKPVLELIQQASQINSAVALENQVIKPDNVREIVERALTKIDSSNEVLVIFGSFFIMVDARIALGIQEPRDSKAIADVAGAGFRAAQDNISASSEIVS